MLELYHQEQQLGKKVVWVAYLEGSFSGYVTLKWHSDLHFFFRKITFQKSQI